MTDIYNYDISTFYDILSPYKYIINTVDKIVLLEYNGILPILNDILGNIIDTAYYIIPFQQILFFNFNTIDLNKIIIKNTAEMYLEYPVILKLKNNKYIKIQGSISSVFVKEYSI